MFYDKQLIDIQLQLAINILMTLKLNYNVDCMFSYFQ